MRTRNRTAIEAMKAKNAEVLTDGVENELYGPAPPVPLATTTTAAAIGHWKLLEQHKLYFNDDGSRKRLTYSMLPPGLRMTVFEFLPVVSDVYMDDLTAVEKILETGDAEVLRDVDLADEVVGRIHKELLEDHGLQFGEFGLIARSLGIPADTPHPRREIYDRRLRRAAHEARYLSARQAKLGQWTAFRVGTFDATCDSLRLTLRSDLKLWESLLKEWRTEREDVAIITAMEELRAIQSRVGGIEYLGSPDLELDDVSNMLWELNIPMPEGLSADYTQSLTFSQVLTIGFVDLPWVKGYAWEDRAAIVEKEKEEATAQGVKLANADDERRAALIQFSSRGARLAAAAAEKQQLEEQQKAAAIKAEEERLAKLERQRAAAVAADSMTQRIWISELQYQARWEHRFGGCEYCNALPIHHVGLTHPCSGALNDIALCNTCYEDMYADEKSVAHRMYQWYVVGDLIGQMEPAIAEPIAPISDLLRKHREEEEIENAKRAEQAVAENEALALEKAARTIRDQNTCATTQGMDEEGDEACNEQMAMSMEVPPTVLTPVAL